MLENLYIRNFILIDKLNIDFAEHFSAFTGETGAGKSIFMDAIGILCGDKLTSSVIKKGAEKTIIEGTFTVNPAMAAKLVDAGYDSDTLIITREINQEGKSANRINQRSCTVGFIRDLLESSVDIHSQHDNQYLLNEKYHLRLLDQYVDEPELMKKMAESYQKYHDLAQEYENLSNTTYNQSQLEFINYQLEEIEKLDLGDDDEDEQIEAKLKFAAEAEKVQETIGEVRTLFTEDGILDKLYEFNRLSANLDKFEAIADNVSHIRDAYYNIADDYETMMDNLKASEIDENEINALNQRLFTIQRMKRKYNQDIAGLKEYRDSLKGQIDAYQNKEFVLSKLAKERDAALEAYNRVAEQVRAARKNGAGKLAKAVEDQLKDLALEKARFQVEFTPTKPSRIGNDEVRFVVAMNAGASFKPLAKVASGGELSRLMLGLKTIFADLEHTELIIFDEIDTGVSGYVSLNIGAKMQQLGKTMQVFAVTHLASVAACADHHYQISKQMSDNSTRTSIERLEGDRRIEELAILSSANTSPSALNAARELLDKAQSMN